MTKSEELEFLKIDLDNVIQGMAICDSILSKDERYYLLLFQRCKSVLDRIKPIGEENKE